MPGSGSSEPMGSGTSCAGQRSQPIGLITHDAKQTGERRTGNPFAPFDEAGAGNGTMRATRQSSTLPVDGGLGEAPAASPSRPRGAGGRRTVGTPLGRRRSRSGAYGAGGVDS